MNVEKYNHHGVDVFVRSDLKGTHRDHCLCHQCDKFYPCTEGNCSIAQELYQFCVRNSMTTPVFECPVYVPKKSSTPQ